MPLSTTQAKSLVEALVAADRWLAAHAEELTAWLTAPESRSTPSPGIVEGRRAAAQMRFDGGEVRWQRWSARIQDVLDTVMNQDDVLNVLAHVIAADFARGRFYDNADLANLDFPGDLILDGSTFARDLWLSSARVRGNLSVRRIKVGKAMLLESMQVSGSSDFLAAEIDGACEARQVRFIGPATFTATDFASDTWFSGSMFFADADFSDCAFSGEAGFGSVGFTGKARFDRARFKSNAGFQNTRFEGAASFVDSEFSGKVWLDNAVFSSPPNIKGARGAAGFPALPGANPVSDQIAELKRRIGVR